LFLYNRNELNNDNDLEVDVSTFPIEGFYLNFTSPIPPGLFHKSDDFSNGGVFNCTWSQNAINIIGGKLNLELYTQDNEWHCAELVTNMNFHYGLFEASIRPSSQYGVVTFFGTYSQNGDEIDIEFNGSNPYEVELNFWSRGINSRGKIIKLDFNVTENYNLYAFNWLPDRLDFYVNNVLVWSTDYSETGIPVDTPSPIILNLWPGTESISDWLGGFIDPANPPENKITASFEWIRFTPFNEK